MGLRTLNQGACLLKKILFEGGTPNTGGHLIEEIRYFLVEQDRHRMHKKIDVFSW